LKGAGEVGRGREGGKKGKNNSSPELLGVSLFPVAKIRKGGKNGSYGERDQEKKKKEKGEITVASPLRKKRSV